MKRRLTIVGALALPAVPGLALSALLGSGAHNASSTSSAARCPVKTAPFR